MTNIQWDSTKTIRQNAETNKVTYSVAQYYAITHKLFYVTGYTAIFNLDLWDSHKTAKDNAIIQNMSASALQYYINKNKLKYTRKKKIILKKISKEDRFYPVSQHREVIFCGGELGENIERGFAYSEGEIV